MNSRVVLDAVRSEGAVTLAQLSRVAGLSRATAEEVLADLTERGLVEELGPDSGHTGAGRPARRFRFRREAGYLAVVGIDMSRMHVRLCDLLGETVASDEVVGDVDRITDSPFQLTHDAIAGCLKSADVPRRLLLAISVGITGVADSSGVIRRSLVLKHWEGADLAGQLRRSFGCAALVENHGFLAVLGEQWKGAAVGADDAVCIVTGIKMAVGVAVAGEALRGRNGAAGETATLPHLRWPRLPEWLAALRERYPGVSAEFAAASASLDAAAGDAVAQRLLGEYASGIAPALAALVLTVDPEVVVIGGALAQAGDHFLVPLRQAVSEWVLFPVPIVRSTLGEEAMVVGAVRRALDHIEDSLLDRAAS